MQLSPNLDPFAQFNFFISAKEKTRKPWIILCNHFSFLDLFLCVNCETLVICCVQKNMILIDYHSLEPTEKITAPKTCSIHVQFPNPSEKVSKSFLEFMVYICTQFRGHCLRRVLQPLHRQGRLLLLGFPLFESADFSSIDRV